MEKPFGTDLVGRCRLTVSKLVLKAPMVSALEAKIWMKRFQTLLFNFNLRRYNLASSVALNKALAVNWWDRPDAARHVRV